MAEKPDQKLKTLSELFNCNSKVSKACTLGVVIDSTGHYFDDNRGHFIKKLKIIDESFNMNTPTHGLKFCYCTVTFYGKRSEDLPNVRVLGDIVYLRRFSFDKYNESFQSQMYKKQFCYWVLVHGSTQAQNFGQYQTSKASFNNQQQKFQNLLPAILELRRFSKEFLENNSINKAIPVGLNPKDEDLVVKMISKGTQGRLKVFTGKQEINLDGCPTLACVGDYGKLRSVARVDVIEGEKVVVKNNFTSLIKIPEWSFDAHNFKKTFLQSQQKLEQQKIFTQLLQLLSMPLNTCLNKKYWIKVQIFAISAGTFTSAVKYYHPQKYQVFDTSHKDTQPVYKLSLHCSDPSMKGKLVEVHLFSFDGKGGNLVKEIDLKELNELSSNVQEDRLYRQRYDQLLQAQNVLMMVQCLTDGKENRALRVIEIKQ